jgi:hypothetical protein
MVNSGSIYAIAEMSQRAEGMALRVRSELFRIGCASEELTTQLRGPLLMLTYRNQTIQADPLEILIVLRKTPTGLDTATVWAQICKKAHRTQKQEAPLSSWVIAFIACAIVFSALFLAKL